MIEKEIVTFNSSESQINNKEIIKKIFLEVNKDYNKTILEKIQQKETHNLHEQETRGVQDRIKQFNNIINY